MVNTDVSKPSSRAERLYRYLSRAFLFVVILLLLFFGLNSFLQPVWFYENNYHTYRSFYEEPRNTIETVFVGASMTLFGISPMELYEQNGICAYNLASTSQPFMMSYYWVREAQRLHADTLDTVVLDVSMLRRTPAEEDYRRALDGMHWSHVKSEAISDLSSSPIDILTYSFPIFGYHDRWSEINYTDFLKFEDNLEDYARGYFMEYHRIFDEFSIEEIGIPTQVLDTEAEPVDLQAESLFYLNKLIKFCTDNDLRLVLYKSPSPANWSSNDHNAVQAIADSYSLEFLDFEVDPLLTEVGYCPPLDSKDLGKHLNYYGAMKLSHYLGTYLAEHCGNRDVRDDQRYAYLDDQLRRYHNKVTTMADATLTDDVADFLSAAMTADNYTLLISVKEEASVSLNASQRVTFDELGLHKLASLGAGDSYLAVITDGNVEYEEIDRVPSYFTQDVDHYIEEIRMNPVEVEDGDVVEDEELEDVAIEVNLDDIAEQSWDDEEATRLPLTHEGQLADGVSYTISSGGTTAGNTSSCLIETEGEDIEYSLGKRGINITVYDDDSHRVVYSTVFDTYASDKRESPALETLLTKERYSKEEYAKLSDNMKRLYRYRRRMAYGIEAKKLKMSIGQGGLYKYLQNFCRDGLIVLLAVKDDGSNALTFESRQALVDMGFTDLEYLEYQDSYCAAVDDGVVIEQRLQRSGDQSATLVSKWFTLTSGGYQSGNIASIVIDDNGYSADYALNARGFNIVVYNPRLDIVCDRASFDTFAVPVDLD